MATKEKQYVQYLRAWCAVKAGGQPHTRDELDMQTAVALGASDAKGTQPSPRTIKDMDTEVKRLLDGAVIG
ncbi:MAG TPA: hypothetical protein VFB81_01860 [Myxococcales bacterium]|nr:hypothetical protein [Myxococcales bacterium]